MKHHHHAEKQRLIGKDQLHWQEKMDSLKTAPGNKRLLSGKQSLEEIRQKTDQLNLKASDQNKTADAKIASQGEPTTSVNVKPILKETPLFKRGMALQVEQPAIATPTVLQTHPIVMPMAIQIEEKNSLKKIIRKCKKFKEKLNKFFNHVI